MLLHAGGGYATIVAAMKKTKQLMGAAALRGAAAYGIGALVAVATAFSAMADDAWQRTRNGVVFKGVEVHNAVALVPTNGFYRFCRVDPHTVKALSPHGQNMAFVSTGVELRFRIRQGEAKLVLGGLDEKTRVTCHVYRGDVICDWPKTSVVVEGTNTVLTFKRDPAAHLAKRAEKFGFRYHPEVFRIVLPPTSQIGIRDVVGDVEPPPPEMMPKQTYLAYGSSITHGSISLCIEWSYAALVGEALGADVRNVGLAGSALMENEIADFVAGEDFDYVSLEMGVNSLRRLSREEYESRVRYMVRKVAESHPKARVLAIDVFRGELSAGQVEKAAAFRETLARVVKELALPNVVYVNGLDALPAKNSLSTGSLHPSPHGHAEIARHLVGKFRQ